MKTNKIGKHYNTPYTVNNEKHLSILYRLLEIDVYMSQFSTFLS